MAVPELPPAVDITADAKKAVIEGLKKAVATFQKNGVFDGNATYQDLIAHPGLLHRFFDCFNENRAMIDDIVRPREGAGPVRDDDQTLVCGVSLNQIQHLLVRTCARKAFEQDKAMETVVETVTKKSFLFFTKTEQVEVHRPSTDPLEERKAREIAKYMAFAWQLPLIEVLRRNLNSQQIMEIGDALVALQSIEDVMAVAQYDGATLKKAKAAAGPEFAEVLAHRPHAVGGIAIWNREMYEFYRKLLGDNAWDFFAREPAFFNVVAALDKPSAKVLGPVLSFVALDNLLELQRLNIDKIEVMVTALKSAFGAELPKILGDPEFGKEFLRKMVDTLAHMTQEKDKLIASFSITTKSMVPTVREWMVTHHHK